MAKNSVSIKDVAAAAGVSTATVSNVFSGKKPVKDELAAKVRKTADQLGYHMNRAASTLRSGRNQIVAVLVPDLADPFFTSVIREIESQAKQDGFEIIVANSDNDTENERSRLDALLSWKPAGLVIIPSTDELPTRLYDAKSDVALVLADRVKDMSLADSIKIDNAGAGAIAAKYLCELGHRHILIVASDESIDPIRERVRGAIEQVAAFGGTADTVTVGNRPEAGADILSHWMDRNARPTAMIALTDMTTLSVLTCLAERRLDVGTDISVVGFDDYPWMVARRTPITAIQQPVSQIALSIWQRLKLRMDGDTSAVSAIELQCTLKIRDSVKPLRSLRDKSSPSNSDTIPIGSDTAEPRRKPVH